jgi:uncharacterized protein (TIGR00269 family)
MRCSCGQRPVYFRRYSGQRFCKDCFNRYFEKKVLDTIRKYDMMRSCEKIGVGISGGKDSTVLLHVLDKLSPQLGITLHPILIDEGIENYREHGTKAAKSTCKTVGHLEIASFERDFGFSLDELLGEAELKPCTYCGVLRRKLLNERSKELGVDRLAVGHNLDDEAQVIMMNYLSGDIERLHRLNGNAESEELIRRVKPLLRLPEKEVMLYALLNKLHISTEECPYAKENYRTRVRDFLNELELERPGLKFSIVNGWEKLIKSEPSSAGTEIRRCSVCHGPTARKICRACVLTEEIKIKMSGAN